MVRVDLTPREKDNTRISSPKTTNPRHKKIRVMGIQGRKLESGVSFTKSLGTILMNIAPNNHYRLRQ
jgi:hypothetical protein